MRQEDFFTTTQDFWEESRSLNHDRLNKLLAGPIIEFTDIECVEVLETIIKNALIDRATSKSDRTIDDDDFRVLVRTSIQVSHRLGLNFPSLPFRDLSSFEAYWKSIGLVGDGSWERRRQLVTTLFEGYGQQITDYLHAIPVAQLGSPLVLVGSPTWDSIDREVADLRTRYASSASEADFNSVGLQCVRVIEKLADLLFDESIHCPPGAVVPHQGQTKNRLECVINSELPGPENAELRKSIRSTIELAQFVKHRSTPRRRDAAISADATILLVSTMRSLTDPQIK